jgi:hypothetical protein
MLPGGLRKSKLMPTELTRRHRRRSQPPRMETGGRPHRMPARHARSSRDTTLRYRGDA